MQDREYDKVKMPGFGCFKSFMFYDGACFIMAGSSEVFNRRCVRPEVAAMFGYCVYAYARRIGPLILFHAPIQFRL